MDGCEAVTSGFALASGDCPELLQPGEEVLDQMAWPVEVAIVVARRPSICFRRDHHGFADRRQGLNEPFVGIEGFIGDGRVGLHVRQQMVSTDQVVCLAAGQEGADRIAKGVDQGMDFGAQSTA